MLQEIDRLFRFNELKSREYKFRFVRNLTQGCGSSDRFRNQPQLPFILFTTPKTARDFPTQNDSEFIIVSLTGRPHYKSRVVFRTVFSENHGHHAGIADFFLLVSCLSMPPLIFLISFVYISFNVSSPPIRLPRVDLLQEKSPSRSFAHGSPAFVFDLCCRALQIYGCSTMIGLISKEIG